MPHKPSDLTKVRLDKWLWAARFFKTRSLAKAAIEGGKIHIQEQRVKPSKEIEIGLFIEIRQGFDEKTVEVLKLSEQRGPAPVAATLYEETSDSVTKRLARAEIRKADGSTHNRPEGKPNTRQRRHIHRFKREILHDE